jgi:signal transduction histidine kinase
LSNKSKPLASRKWLATSIIVILSISAVSIGIMFYFQDATKAKIRADLFQDEKEKQIRATKFIAKAVESDLDSIRSKLQVLAMSSNFQNGELTGPSSTELLNNVKSEIDDVIPMSALYILDRDNIVVYSSQTDQFNGADVSSREYVKELRESMKPVFSNSFKALDGTSRITVVYPIINRQTGDFIGTVGLGIIADPFFSQYGNIEDFSSGQYLNALDRNHVFVATPNKEIVGVSFDDTAFREKWTGNNPTLIGAYADLFSGKSVSSVFDVGFGERLMTGEPVVIDGSAKYYISLGIPTSVIYSEVNSILAEQELFQLYQILAIIAGVVAVIALLVRNNSYLGKKVIERTQELENSNTKLSEANKEIAQAYEQLKIHDRLQNEFVNVAAHELRTPIQPLLGAAELMETQFEGRDKIEVTRPEIEMILRNAKRLERLAADILEISRIESGALKLNKEDFSLAYMIADAVRDARAQSVFNSGELAIAYNADDIFVHADREKTTQVITNLLTNAIKFTQKGTISITTQRDRRTGFVIVTVQDTGSGIDPEILPKLFEKFVTRSDKGTGIGLFISKKIVEAHGGKIRGKNNEGGTGATFTFSLPLAQQELEQEKGTPSPASNQAERVRASE